MTPSRPYLIRAVHEWILDNGMTPYVLVNAQMTGVNVPRQYIENGKIKLIKEYCDSALVERVLGPFPQERKRAAG